LQLGKRLFFDQSDLKVPIEIVRQADYYVGMVMANINTDNLLTTAEAADFLGGGIRPETIQKHIVRQNLKAIKFGSSWMIEKDELIKFSDKRRPPGRPSN
jgi:excisionase family DNA binding protein